MSTPNPGTVLGTAPTLRARLVTPPVVAGLIIVLALGARARVCLAENSLYVDEAMLSVNVLDRGYDGLVDKLEYNQHAPVGFLVAVKVATQSVSDREFGLRLVPFLAGALALLVFWWAATRAIRQWPAVLAVALLALTRPVADYSVTVKQYSSDVLFTCLILLLIGRRGAPEWRVVLSPVFLLLAALAPWVSQPSVFVLAGVYLVAFLTAIRGEGRARVAWVMFAATPWAVSFASNYWYCIRPGLVANDVLFEFWAEGFAPWPTSPERIKWYLTRPFVLFEYPGGFRLAGGVAVAALIVGLATMRGPAVFVRNVIVAAVGLAIVAAGLHLYALHDRMALWMVPLLVLPVASSVATLFERREGLLWGGVLVAILVVFPLLGTVQQLARPEPGKLELKPLLAVVTAEGIAGDDIFLTGSSGPAFRYYARGGAFAGFHVTESRGTTWDEKRAELRRLAGRQRVWVVFCGDSWRFGAPEETVTRDWLREMGIVRAEYRAPGGAVLLIDFHDRPAP